jgi:hypothetical protein
MSFRDPVVGPPIGPLVSAALQDPVGENKQEQHKNKQEEQVRMKMKMSQLVKKIVPSK